MSPGAAQRTELAADQSKKLGRGFIFILFAKGYFMVMGFAIQFGLPRLFQRAAIGLIAAGKYSGMSASRVAEMLYGDYGIAVRSVSWINNTMVQGTIQAVSKYVAEDDQRAPAVKLAALRLQAMVGGVLAATYFAFAHFMAAILGDPNLARYFRITAIIILAYALYAVFIGTLNGQKQFRAQAAFDVAYSSMRAFLMLGTAALGFGVGEVLWGFSGASIIICLLAALVVGVRLPRGAASSIPHFHWHMLVKGMSQVVLYFIVFNFLLAADLWIVKALAGRVSGIPAEQAASLSSALTGIYTGVQALALIPYQAVLAIAFVVFPVVSRSTFDEDHEATSAYVNTTMRYALLFVVLVSCTISASADGLLAVLKPSFAVAAPALRIYVTGEIFFALFAVANTVIIASGRMKTAIILAAVTLLADIAANLILVPRYLYLITAADGTPALDTVALTASAVATSGAFFLGFCLSLLALSRLFRARLHPLSLIRVTASAALAILVPTRLLTFLGLSPGLPATLLGSILAAILFLGGLLLLKEITAADRDRVRNVLERRKKKA